MSANAMQQRCEIHGILNKTLISPQMYVVTALLPEKAYPVASIQNK